jgi:hypothetical protein
MRKLLKVGLPIIVAILITACETPNTVRVNYDTAELAAEAALQREMALKKFLNYSVRLEDVSYPILRAATKFCPEDLVNSFGAAGSASTDFSNEWYSVANKVLGGTGFTITWVANNGAASRSGIAVNDKVISVNGVNFSEEPKQLEKFYAELNRVRTSRDIEATLILKRGQQLLDLNINLEKTCGFPVVLSNSSEVNAYANGKQIIITKGMMRFARDDQDLALVIAHELGHNLMDHIDKKVNNRLLGSIVDIAAAAYGVNTQGLFRNAGTQAFSQYFEAEADYVALYYMHAAGLPLDGVADFWRDMAAEHPANIGSNHSASHPATSERFVAISKTIEEIDRKVASGQPVTPNLKK